MAKLGPVTYNLWDEAYPYRELFALLRDSRIFGLLPCRDRGGERGA